jgi:hypothetical protein
MCRMRNRLFYVSILLQRSPRYPTLLFSQDEVACSIEWLVFNYKTTRCRKPEEYNLNLCVCTEEHTDVNFLFKVAAMYNIFIYIFMCLGAGIAQSV